MKYWLLKSEPTCYSIDDLRREKVGQWDGVRNYQARNFMRSEMQKGDLALFYHSNTDHIGVVGVCEIASTKAYPDPTQFDTKADHYDPKSTKENPRWYLIDVKFKKKFKKILPLAVLKNDPFFNDMPLTQKGMRLSVQPVSKKHFDRILKMVDV